MIIVYDGVVCRSCGCSRKSSFNSVFSEVFFVVLVVLTDITK